MQEEKHREALKEVKKAVEEAIKDSEGLLSRQRLLMSALSLGTQHLVELWLHAFRAMKPGAAIKHEWLASEDRRLRLRLAGIVTKDVHHLTGADKIFAFAREIERDRNDIIYGAPLSSDLMLRKKIEIFMELKKAVEESTGEAVW